VGRLDGPGRQEWEPANILGATQAANPVACHPHNIIGPSGGTADSNQTAAKIPPVVSLSCTAVNGLKKRLHLFATLPLTLLTPRCHPIHELPLHSLSGCQISRVAYATIR
jgi:hypothetical protein